MNGGGIWKPPSASTSGRAAGSSCFCHWASVWATCGRCSPAGGGWLVANRVLGLSRLALCWAAFMFRETDIGLRLTRIDEAVRLMLIPLLLIAAISSLSGYGPFKGDPGTLGW